MGSWIMVKYFLLYCIEAKKGQRITDYYVLFWTQSVDHAVNVSNDDDCQ